MNRWIDWLLATRPLHRNLSLRVHKGKDLAPFDFFFHRLTDSKAKPTFKDWRCIRSQVLLLFHIESFCRVGERAFHRQVTYLRKERRDPIEVSVIVCGLSSKKNIHLVVVAWRGRDECLFVSPFVLTVHTLSCNKKSFLLSKGIPKLAFSPSCLSIYYSLAWTWRERDPFKGIRADCLTSGTLTIEKWSSPGAN